MVVEGEEDEFVKCEDEFVKCVCLNEVLNK